MDQTMDSLDQFIATHIERVRPLGINRYVTHDDFSLLYVRMTSRYVAGILQTPCLDIANIEAKAPGTGGFTRLFGVLRERYPQLHLYVECVLSPRFGQHLMKLGFIKLHPRLHGCGSYFYSSGSYFFPGRVS